MSSKIDLKEVFDEQIILVEPIINKLLICDVSPRCIEVQKHQMLAGGKRIRPVICMTACQLVGGKPKDVLYPAAALEIMHNYTLIVDDIIDNSSLRRGVPTVWKKYGRSIADLAGVYYISSVMQGISHSNKPALIGELLGKNLKKITDGQVLDMLFERFGRDDEPYVVENRYKKITVDDYTEMVGEKTAVLFKTCCEVAGISANASEKEIKALGSFGQNLGISFQIRDDFLDIFGDEKKFGKKVGKDIEERKVGNIVVLFALEELTKKDEERLNKIFLLKKIDDPDVKEAIGLIEKTNAKKKAQNLALKFNKASKEHLKLLPQNKWNDVLAKIADFVIGRER